MKNSVCFLLMLILILQVLKVNSQNLLSDLLERVNNNNNGDMVEDEPDDLDAIVEDTRLKMIRLMRRSPAEKPPVDSGKEAAPKPPRRKVTPTNVDPKSPVENWTGRWFPEAVTEAPRRKVNPTNIEDTKSSEENWTGRWLPDKITERPRPKTNKMLPENNMWQMINTTCDDGRTNLTVDWDLSAINFTCYYPSKVFLPDPAVKGIIERDYIPAEYSARHVCMSSTIEYYNTLPTFGPHRPAWPMYGEYLFVPRQRWLHNLEHGGVVMLYHPCAHPLLVQKLRKIVKSCLYRHIITPYTLLPQERPLALVTWGWAYLMPDVDEDSVVKFIQEHALNGPEHTYADGQYDQLLVERSEVVSTIEDAVVCPFYKLHN